MTSLADHLPGTWELVNWQRFREGAADSYPFGEDATGQIMFDKASDAGGYMSGFLARSDWAEHKPATTADYVGSFFSYGGTWELKDVDGQATLHHGVEFASYPKWIGGTQVRHATLDGDLLHLEMRDEKSTDPTANFDRLTWRKREA